MGIDNLRRRFISVCIHHRLPDSSLPVKHISSPPFLSRFLFHLTRICSCLVKSRQKELDFQIRIYILDWIRLEQARPCYCFIFLILNLSFVFLSDHLFSLSVLVGFAEQRAGTRPANHHWRLYPLSWLKANSFLHHLSRHSFILVPLPSPFSVALHSQATTTCSTFTISTTSIHPPPPPPMISAIQRFALDLSVSIQHNLIQFIYQLICFLFLRRCLLGAVYVCQVLYSASSNPED